MPLKLSYMEGSARASTQIRTAPNLLVVYATGDVAFILQKYKWITFRQVLFSGNAHNLLMSRSCITKNKNMQSIEEHSQRERSSYCRNLVNHLSRSWIHFSKRVVSSWQIYRARNVIIQVISGNGLTGLLISLSDKKVVWKICVIDLTGYSVEITDLLSEATKKVRKSEKYHFFIV